MSTTGTPTQPRSVIPRQRCSQRGGIKVCSSTSLLSRSLSFPNHWKNVCVSPPTPPSTSAAMNLILVSASSCFRNPVDHKTFNDLCARPRHRNLFVRASLYHVGLRHQRRQPPTALAPTALISPSGSSWVFEGTTLPRNGSVLPPTVMISPSGSSLSCMPLAENLAGTILPRTGIVQ